MTDTTITPHQVQVLYPLCVNRERMITVKGTIRDSAGKEITPKCLSSMVKKGFIRLVEGGSSSYKVTRTGISAVLSCLNTQEFRALEREHGMIEYGG